MKKYAALYATFAVLAAGCLLGANHAEATTLTVSGDTVGFATGAQFLWESPTDQQRDVDNMVATGAKWLRLDLPWPSIQQTATTPSANWNWATFDRIVTLARSRGLSIIGLPSYTPAWAKAPGAVGAAGPADPQAFANFVSVLVNRYRPQGITTWEIWNEPNQSWSWNPPSPAAYTVLLKKAYAAVKAADPTATVLTAGLAPAPDAADGSQIKPTTFVNGIYANGGKGYFDAMAMHPYCYPYMPGDPTTASWSAWFNMPTIHQTMVNNGDGTKKIWITEMGSPTGTGSGVSSESNQVNYVNAAFSARDQWSYLGPMIWFVARDAGTDIANDQQNFGLWRFDFSNKPALATYKSHIDNVAPTSTTNSTTTSTTNTTSTSTSTTTSTSTSTTTTTVPPATTTQKKRRPRRG